MRIKGKENKYKAGIITLVFLILLYFLLKQSLPQYSGRIPLLGIFLVIEYLAFNFIRDAKPILSEKFKDVLIIIWWLPVILMVIFLLIAGFVPLQNWGRFWQTYIVGYGVMSLLAKSIMFVLLIPPLILEIIRKVLKRRINVGGFYYLLEKFLKRMAIIIGGIAFVGLFIGSIHWVSKFKTREVEIQINDLPQNLEGFRIVQISDVHLGSWMTTKPIERAVEIINELNPDLVLFTGDLVNFSSNETSGFDIALRKIKSKHGIYAIMGNHDYGDYVPWPDSLSKENDIKRLENFYKKIGWTLLRNENRVLSIDTSTILLAGVENWSATARFHRYGDMQLTMMHAPQTDVSVLMSHDPTHWEAEVVKRYPRFDLTLSGHTHGMQIGFEGFGIKWSPSQYVYKNWGGLYTKKISSDRSIQLYVNLGLGHIAYPGRVGILPEITLLTLTKK